MANDHIIRASDVDREAVVAVLRDAYTAGRLDAEEFDERTTAAYGGKTWGELRTLTEDLPEQPVLGADLPAARPPAIMPPGPVPPRNGRGRPFVPVLPIFAIWFLITVAAHSPAAAPVAVVALVMMMVFVSSGRRHRHGGGTSPGPRDGSGPGDNHDAP